MTAIVWTTFWLLVQDPSRRVIIACCTDELARFHGEAIRERIESYGGAHGVFLKRGSKRANHFGTTAGGYVRLVGVGGMTTGFPASHFLMDDLFKDWLDAASPTQQQRRWLWAASVARTRLQHNGHLMHVGTRWNEHDVAGKMIENTPGRWRMLRVPAICDSDDDPLGRAVGDPLPKPGVDERDTATLLADWYEARDDVPVLVWDAMYQADPHPPGGALIDADQLSHIEDLAPTAQAVTRAVSLDPSTGKESAAEGTEGRQSTFGIVAGWLGDDARVYLTVDATRVMTPEEGCRRACEVAYDTQAGIIYLEGNQGGHAWRPLMVSAWGALVASKRVRGRMPKLEIHTARGDKVLRAQMVAGAMTTGHVRLAAKLPSLWREWTGWRSGDESPGRIDASGHLVLKLLPEQAMNYTRAASPADSPLSTPGEAPSAYPWRG